MTFKKETEKIVSLQMKGLVHFYHPPVILFERGKKYCRAAILWKGTNWKFIFLWRKINWYGLQIAKRHFNYTIWLITKKKYYGIHVSSPWWYAYVPTVSANKAYRKNCLLEFPIAWTHIYIYRKKEFRNISEKKLYNLFDRACCLLNF